MIDVHECGNMWQHPWYLRQHVRSQTKHINNYGICGTFVKSNNSLSRHRLEASGSQLSLLPSAGASGSAQVPNAEERPSWSALETPSVRESLCLVRSVFKSPGTKSGPVHESRDTSALQPHYYRGFGNALATPLLPFRSGELSVKPGPGAPALYRPPSAAAAVAAASSATCFIVVCFYVLCFYVLMCCSLFCVCYCCCYLM